VHYQLLGPFDVFDEDGQSLALGGERQRALLVLLLLNANEVVSTDRIIDSLWAEDPPETATNIVQVYVSRLRKALEPDLVRGDKPSVFLTRRPGYSLRVADDSVDATVFSRLAKEGRAALDSGRPGLAATQLRTALDLWRGEAIADFAYESFAAPVVARLTDERVAATEDLLEARLALGEHDQLVPELEALVDRYPYRERLHGQLMLALYRSGRQGDALRAYRDAEESLLDELGIDPGPELQRLESQILNQDPNLELEGIRSADLASFPLIGRTRHVAALAEAVALVSAGGSVIIRLIGEAEAGIERLLDEASTLSEAAGLALNRTRAFEAEPPGALIKRLDLGSEDPSVFVIQSAHFAGPDSLAMLGARLRSDKPTLVVTGQTPQPGRADQGLQRLGESVPMVDLAIDRVSRPELGEVTDALFADWLFEQTSGDSFELSRLLELLRDRGLVAVSDGRIVFTAAEFPDDPSLPLGAQVSALDPDDRLIVEACGIARAIVPLRVVARLVGEPPLAVVDRVDRLVGAGFLHESSDGITVSTALAAGRLSGRIGAARRSAVAEALLAAWEDQAEVADEAAVGLLADLAGVSALAVSTLMRVADRYMARQQLSEAQPLLETAVRGLAAMGEDSGPRWGHVHLQLASCHRLAGWPDLANDALQQAILYTDGVECVDAWGWAAQIASDGQDPATAEWMASVGQLRAFQLEAPAKAASLLSLQGHVLNRLGYPIEADLCSSRSRLVLGEIGEPQQKFLAAYNESWIELDRGNARRAEAGFARLLDRVVDDSDARKPDLMAWQSRCLFRLGRVDEATQTADAALKLATRSGDVGPVFLVHMAVAEGAVMYSHGADANAAATEMLGVVLLQLPAWENAARYLLAKAHLAEGLLDAASDELANAMDTCPPGVSGRRWRLTCEALGHLIEGERGKALDHSADQLIEDLLAVQWHEPALDLLIAQAGGRQDPGPAIHAAKLAVELGLASAAGRAFSAVHGLGGELDDLMMDGVDRLIRRALVTMPESWREAFSATLGSVAPGFSDYPNR